MMLANILPPKMAYAKFNYFDILVLVWLFIGVLRGRKRGLSQELLPTLQWIAIVVVAGMFYWPLAQILRPYTQFTRLWSSISSYFLIALGIHIVYLWFKQMLGTKLVEKDPFGRAEFYVGMMAGAVRFGCMIMVGLALMNSRIQSATELAQTQKFQERWFSDIRFPTYGEFQQDVLFKSVTGNFVEVNLQPILIASTDAPAPKKAEDSIAQKKNKELDDIMGSGKK